MTKKFLLSLLVFALTMTAVIAFTYHRVFIVKDYVIQYSVACDPTVEYCYEEDCAEEECEPYYYSVIQKEARDLFDACGSDMDGCAESQFCAPTDSFCEITTCDPETETCVRHEPENDEVPLDEDESDEQSAE